MWQYNCWIQLLDIIKKNAYSSRLIFSDLLLIPFVYPTLKQKAMINKFVREFCEMYISDVHAYKKQKQFLLKYTSSEFHVNKQFYVVHQWEITFQNQS